MSQEHDLEPGLPDATEHVEQEGTAPNNAEEHSEQFAGSIVELPESDVEYPEEDVSPDDPPAQGFREDPTVSVPSADVDSVPRIAQRAKQVEAPPRRSFGRVTRIQEETAIAWVADFRPLGRDVLVRLQNPWQANPGHILEYELKHAAAGGNRWTGVDTVFNFKPNLDRVLALDEGRGLSYAGLDWVMRAIAAEPGLLGRIFGSASGGAGTEGAHVSKRLKQQLLEAEAFPLPRVLLFALLSVPGLAERAAWRLLKTPLRSPQEAARLLVAVPSREEAGLLERIARDHGDWLDQPLDLPEAGLESRVLRWWRHTRDLRWLRQMPAHFLPPEAGLTLLEAGVFGNRADFPGEELQAWTRHLGSVDRHRLLLAAFHDPARATVSADPLEGLGAELREILSGLANDPVWGEEARARLLERAELTPAAALELLQKGATGESRGRLLSILSQAPVAERPQPDGALAMELFQQAVGNAEAQESQATRDWVGSHPAVQERVESWLADPATRELGLHALCHAPAFNRGGVQRLLGMQLSPALRAGLVSAISRVSPERWEDRYLLNESERTAWVEAGAPLK